jgi:hypothetical protein
MAASGCNFCGKVGMQPISNDRTTFNYDCLEVKNKKSDKNENQKKTAKNQSAKGNQVCQVCNLHYPCEVAKLGTAATGSFLSGKRKKRKHQLL